MKSTLVILAHPQFHMSSVNKLLMETAELAENTDVLDLYDTYPDLYIDVRKEKNRLLSYDNIILQFPFQWYSCPSLLKEWMDTVLTRGLEFDDDAANLKDKNLLCVITTGGTKYSYSKRGHNRFTINDFLTPFDQTAHMCSMNYAAPFVIYKAHHLDEQEMAKYAKDYLALLKKFNGKKTTKRKDKDT